MKANLRKMAAAIITLLMLGVTVPLLAPPASANPPIVLDEGGCDMNPGGGGIGDDCELWDQLDCEIYAGILEQLRRDIRKRPLLSPLDIVKYIKIVREYRDNLCADRFDLPRY